MAAYTPNFPGAGTVMEEAWLRVRAEDARRDAPRAVLRVRLKPSSVFSVREVSRSPSQSASGSWAVPTWTYWGPGSIAPWP